MSTAAPSDVVDGATIQVQLLQTAVDAAGDTLPLDSRLAVIHAALEAFRYTLCAPTLCRIHLHSHQQLPHRFPPLSSPGPMDAYRDAAASKRDASLLQPLQSFLVRTAEMCGDPSARASSSQSVLAVSALMRFALATAQLCSHIAAARVLLGPLSTRPVAAEDVPVLQRLLQKHVTLLGKCAPNTPAAAAAVRPLTPSTRSPHRFWCGW